MRRFTIVLSIALILLVIYLPTRAQGSGLLTQVMTSVWLRSGPGTEWRRIEVLEPGRAILLDGQAVGWVRGITSTGNVGWVRATTVNLNADQLASLPTVYTDTPFSLAAPPTSADSTTAPAPVSSNNSTTTVGTGTGTLVTTSINVNMRRGPGTSYRRILTVNAGTPIMLDGRDRSGRWVRGIIENGTWGWVITSAVNLSQDQLFAMGIINVNTPFTITFAPPQPTPAPVVVVNNPPANNPPASNPPVNNPPVGGPPVVPPPVVVGPPVAGFGYGGHVQHFNDTTFSYMQSARMSWVKMQWRYFAGHDASSLAGAINTAHAYGFRILIGVVGLTSEMGGAGYYDQYAGFVGGLAAHGADAIEIWNEPNIDREWPSGQIGASNYLALLAPAYNAIKANNPNTIVISAAPAPTGYFGGCHGGGCDDIYFMQQLAAAGGASYLDCIGVHYNEGIVSPDQTSGDPRGDHYTRYFWGMLNTYDAAFGGSRPLCFTEFGFLSPEGYGGLPGGFEWAGATTVAQQAAWIDTAVAQGASSGRVLIMIVWNVDYTGQYGADPTGGYSIIRPDGTCPACVALGS
jgi:uncharacterized protein YraI